MYLGWHIFQFSFFYDLWNFKMGKFCQLEKKLSFVKRVLWRKLIEGKHASHILRSGVSWQCTQDIFMHVQAIFKFNLENMKNKKIFMNSVQEVGLFWWSHRLGLTGRSFEITSLKYTIPGELKNVKGEVFSKRLKKYLLCKSFYSVDEFFNERIM